MINRYLIAFVAAFILAHNGPAAAALLSSPMNLKFDLTTQLNAQNEQMNKAPAPSPTSFKSAEPLLIWC